MFQLRERLDSYHYHKCIIIPEKDVLDVDIVGTNRIANFRRWWNDLFLLSYECDKYRCFYTSSNALRMERYRQFRKHKNCIHPLSKFRYYWDFIILYVFVTIKFITRLTSNFLYDRLPISFYLLGAFLELVVFAGLYVDMITGYIDKESRRVVLSRKKAILNYCERKLFLHVASAIPLHWLMFLRYGDNINCGLCKCNKFICALKILDSFSLFRVIETSTCWSRKRYSKVKESLCKFLRIGTVTFATLIQLTELSDVFTLLMFFHYKQVDEESILSFRAGLKYGWNGVGNFMFFMFDIGKMLKPLTRITQINATVERFVLDKLFSFLGFIITYIFYAWAMVECFSFLTFVISAESQRMTSKQKTMNVLESLQVSDTLSEKVSDYFKYKSSALRLTEARNGLYVVLPTILKNEINLNCYFNIILRIPLFSQWPIPVLEQLTIMLKRKEYMINDMVTVAKASGEGLMIVHDGVLAVYSSTNKELGHLIDGDYFGALSLVTDKEVYMTYVVAVTNATVLFLSKMEFRMYMKDHPQLFYGFEMDLKKRYRDRARNQADASIGSIRSQ
ncbi:potassium/sodium hyperpolarization-activated cyclic nucleotide-gated channel 1-like [Spodoptera litura]|uniref:Potassium/sodium hyperpolarization-activated cyclic nucleotide-gated channel 1-like n=1 Tax=Spodoptera litura TaxID=69820 RepID=A0A9J7ER89_SPOLT|nr:potassium/sodium hyperpolarization-activated cyclic nucleotide-gated channel 1-like [Spodoptera litura]